MRNLIASILFISSASVFAAATDTATPVTGPTAGTLLVVGGGDKTSIWPTFLDLAGGKDAPIVVITTASPKNGADNKDFQELQALGATHLTLLHTDDRTKANSNEFTAPLREAKAVWITGGRQWRLVDSYLNTKTEKEIFNLLDRGGVVGGSSAGASIQASYLLRGARSGNSVLMAAGYEEGFGFLKNTAVDQHVNTRGRAEDMLQVLEAHPNLLGIGLDESTGIIVRKDRADVIGAGYAHFTAREVGKDRSFELQSGGAFDLGSRHPIDLVSEQAGDQGTTAKDPGTVRVAIYADEGSPKAPDLIEGCLGTLPEKFHLERVTADQIRQGVLSNFDVIAQGGGRASLQAEALGDDGKEKIREFLRKGGGYVGICAGAYLAASDRPYYLRIVNARVVDREHWARGGGDVQIRFTDEGKTELRQETPVVQIRYNQGPLLARDSQADLPSYTELAVYETEIAKKGAPEGVMKGTSAMISAPFGNGRVFLSSPHPERTPGLESILQSAVLWVAKRDTPANP
ncbi:cyanophycinase [Terrimicrobium sacchariphilum]|jgi:cyanophycinase|uniref:Cyanophycinase n=1 Tax=Terrimicrobium sacchariphilum TaxID=690879 RepID=A0A146GFV0_TERSA|nr:Type 1 glutamine amidotransferase-like domain-containing protein [Terrimicrobium sacchariphilum]GAT35328.1 cyanophycinase [Terrimicrobium sacchariphilum]